MSTAPLHHTSQTMIDINNVIHNRNTHPRPPPPGPWAMYNPFYYTTGYVYGPNFPATLYVPGSTNTIPSIYAPATIATPKPTAIPTLAPTLAPTMAPFNQALEVMPVSTSTPAPKESGMAPPMMSVLLVVCCCISVAAFAMMRK